MQSICLSEVQLASWKWFETPGPIPFEFSLGIDLNPVVLMFAFCCTISAIGFLFSQPGRKSAVEFTILCALVLSLLVQLISPNLLQALAAWWLTALLAHSLLLLGRKHQPGTAIAKLRSHAVTELLGFVVLLISVGFCWSQFGTFEIDRISAEVWDDSDDLPGMAAVISTIGYCIVFAVLIRCAQFPFCIWVPGLYEHDRQTHQAPLEQNKISDTCDGAYCDGACAVLIGVVMPVSVHLLVQFLPVLQSHLQISSTTAYLSVLSACVCTLFSMVSKSWRLVLTYLGIVQIAFVIVGLIATAATTRTAALMLLLMHMLVFPMLWVCCKCYVADLAATPAEASAPGPPARYFRLRMLPLIALSYVWLSGFWGQNTILGTMDFSFAGNDAVTPLAPRSTFNVLPVFMTVIYFFVSFALVRIVLLARRDETVEQQLSHADTSINRQLSGSKFGVYYSLFTVGMLVAAALATVYAPNRLEEFIGKNSAVLWNTEALIRLDVGTVAALAGLVVAWMLYHQANRWPEQLGRMFGPLQRLADNQFYMQELSYYGLNLPIRAAALLLRFFEWLVVDRVVLKTLAGLARLITTFARPLQSGLLQFYLLSILLSLGVLMYLVLGD